MHRLLVAAHHDHQALAQHPGQHVQLGVPGGPADRLHHQLAVTVRRGAHHHPDLAGLAPAERGGPGQHALVGVAGEQRVDHQGLQPGVPGAPGLGGLRVHLGGGEGDLPGVDQHRLAHVGFVAGGGHLLDRLLHHLDGGADQLDGLAQGDRPGQLARRGAEDVGGDRLRGVRLAVPLGERGDTGLGDQADPGPVLRRHPPVPAELVVHPGDRGGGELAGGLLQPLEGRGPALGAVGGEPALLRGQARCRPPGPVSPGTGRRALPVPVGGGRIALGVRGGGWHRDKTASPE